MQKIKTLFKLEKIATNSRKVKVAAIDELVEGSEWVLDAKEQDNVTAYIKLDGTPALYKNGMLYKRLRVKNSIEKNKFIAEGAILAQEEYVDGYYLWIPITVNNPEDKWFIEALNNELELLKDGELLEETTYELVGPRINKNVHNFPKHRLIKHTAFVVNNFMPSVTFHEGQTQFEIIKELIRVLYRTETPILYFDTTINQDWYLERPEGIVWHHKDGRMVKMRYTDFKYD